MASLSTHASHCVRFLHALSSQMLEVDSVRMIIAFYCLSSLDVLDQLDAKSKKADRDQWREWIWAQQISSSWGTGFRSGPSVAIPASNTQAPNPGQYDVPHVLMTFSAILSLAILRDDLKRLDRTGLRTFLCRMQRPDGSFTAIPNSIESDLRMVYAVFVICSLLNEWDAINVQKALEFIHNCRTYEGGYGQRPYLEAQGGTTFCALGSLALCPSAPELSANDRSRTLRWLCGRQIGGFQGRTEKGQDACYSFWCGGSLKILGAEQFVNVKANAEFLRECQFKFGGIAKAPGDHPDPMHTYLSLAALSIYPFSDEMQSLKGVDVAVNATQETAAWARQHLNASPN